MQNDHIRGMLIVGMVVLASCAGTPKDHKTAAQSELHSGAFAPFDAVAFSSEKSAAGRLQTRLAFSARVAGEVAECGCAVNPRGGVDRRYQFILSERLTLKTPLQLSVLDAGNSLFSSEVIDPMLRYEGIERARWILKAHNKMKVRAQNVGFLDLSLGVDFLKDEAHKAGVPLVSSNLMDPQGHPVFSPREVLDLGAGVFASVIGLTAGPSHLPEGLRVESPLEVAEKLIATVPAEHLVIVLSDLGRAMEESLAEKSSRALIIVGSRDHDGLEHPLQVNRSVIIQPQIQGQQWSVLDIWWHPGVTSWSSAEGAERAARQWPLLAGAEADRLRVYEPVALNGKGLFEHRLVDMTGAWDGKNEFTSVVKKFSPRR